MVPGQRCGTGEARDAGVRSGIREPSSYDHPRCRERATCVLDPGRCEPPDDRRSNSTVPGCGASSRGARGSPVDRITAEKKNFCCVTTGRRKLWVFNGLGRSLGALTALALGLGVSAFGLGILTMFGLSPGRLPLADPAETFRLLAVALIPAPRLVGASAAFAHATPRARSAPSGPAVGLSLNVEGAHGRIELPREKLGEDVSAFSPGALKSRTRQSPTSLKTWKQTRQRPKPIQRRALEEDTRIETACHSALRMIRNGADSPTGPRAHRTRMARGRAAECARGPRRLMEQIC